MFPISLPEKLMVSSSETSTLLLLHRIYFMSAANSVPMPAKTNQKAKKPRAVFFGNKIENYCGVFKLVKEQ
jgi:hypothetical protein